MLVNMSKITRRELLKQSIIAGGALGLAPWIESRHQEVWPESQKLGRVCKGKVFVRAKPYVNSTVVKEIYDDAVVVWIRDVVGENPGLGSSVWVETTDGYIYAPRLQSVYNKQNAPVHIFPVTTLGKGMWVEVTVPYIDLSIINPPIRAKGVEIPRLYYSQVVWVDDVRSNDRDELEYRVNEKYGYGDLYWASAKGLKQITADDISPINPNVENKRIQVNLNYQTLTCFEGNNEVFFCRISSGGKYDADGNPSETWSTPVGPHPIYRKLISLYMSGLVTGNWSGVPWTAFITGEGVAVHSTYWHNEFGVPRSHGCINARPEDAKWIFRWTYPPISLDPGELDVHLNWPPVGTVVNVIE
jgi:hypothetical protein